MFIDIHSHAFRITTPVFRFCTPEQLIRRYDKMKVDMAVLTLPKEAAAEVAHTLAEAGVRAFWNFTSTELQDLAPTCTVETVHLGDSLMTLCYRLRSNGEDA